MRRALLTIAALALFATLATAADGDKDKPLLGKKAAELQIDMPNGKPLLLSSYKGKVVCLQFIFTTCVHCQHATQLTTKLAKEFNDPGFQPIAVAVNEMAGMLVKDFVKDYKITYPVGFTTQDNELHYLQIDKMKRWVVPQVLIIDRKGIVRYQTPWTGDEKVQDEAFMRTTLKGLLAEASVGAAPAKKPATPAPAKATTAPAAASAKKPDTGTK